MNDEIPPLQRPEDMPPIHSQADLHRLWRALMGELGFAARQLWLVMLDAHNRCTPVIQKVEELPDVPDPQTLDGLMTVCRGIVDEVLPGGSVAFLLARPGPAGLTASDRAWASGLATAVRDREVASHPVHLANDHEIRVYTPDDEVASA
jgi:hypothetical protein